MNELIDPETHEPGTDYDMMYRSLKQEYESLQLLKKSNEVRLRDALRKLLAAQLSAVQDNDDESSAHVQNSVAFQDEEAKQDGALQDEVMQDTAQSDDAGRSSG